MPFDTVVLNPPGVKALQTPTLLKTSVVAANLIRWNGGLPEKLGGWSNMLGPVFNPSSPAGYSVQGITRKMHAWADLNGNNHLAMAGIIDPSSSSGNGVVTVATLAPVADQAIVDATPQWQVTITTNYQSVTGLPYVMVNDLLAPNTPLMAPGTVVWIQNHVCVGASVLFGLYTINNPAASTVNPGGTYYEIVPATPPSTSEFGPPAPGPGMPHVLVPQFSCSIGSNIITVNMPSHGLSVGSLFTIVIPTAVGFTSLSSITLQGFFNVHTVIDANHFTILAPIAALSTATVFEGGSSGGIAQVVYFPSWPPGVAGWGSDYPPNYTGGLNSGLGTVSADSWSLINFGSNLIENPINGPLFAWNPLSQYAPQIIKNAPIAARGCFLAMPQQQIVVYGGSTDLVQDDMLVQFCDNANYNVWTASVLNQAGSFRLTRGSRIVSGCQGPQVAMLWTDVGLWLMTYIGYPDVWGFNEIAQGCGIVSKDAWCVYGPQVFWMGHQGFWNFANGVVQRLHCDVWDIIIKNLDISQSPIGNFLYFGHIKAAANSDYDEVTWHFPSAASANGENDSFVKYTVTTGEWDYSFSTPQPGLTSPTPIQVTSWLDQNVLGLPISSMLNTAFTPARSLIMQHETSADANGPPPGYTGAPWTGAPLTWMITTGFFMLQDGEDKVFVDYMIPDFKWRRLNQPSSVSAVVQLTLYVTDYPDNPNQPPVALGPYTVTNATGAIEIRCRGRYFYIVMEGSDLGSWVRLGGFKFRFAPDGRN